VIDQIVTETRVLHPLGQRHAHGGGNALPQRPGGGLDPLGMAVFGMPGGARAKLAEGAQLIGAHIVVAQQVVDRIDQHGPMARAQYEPVAIGPVGRLRIVTKIFAPQHSRDVGHAHRHPRMARIRRLDRVHRQHADRGGHQLFVGFHLGLDGHGMPPQARFDSLTSRRIIGVKISCMARSILPPGITSELARVIQLPWIIELR
jgi:hypothetical protein